MTNQFNRHGEYSARPEKENTPTTGNRRGAGAEQSGQDEYIATIMTPLEFALDRKPIEAAQLEVLGRIAKALEGQEAATRSVSKQLDDLWKLLAGRI